MVDYIGRHKKVCADCLKKLPNFQFWTIEPYFKSFFPSPCIPSKYDIAFTLFEITNGFQCILFSDETDSISLHLYSINI